MTQDHETEPLETPQEDAPGPDARVLLADLFECSVRIAHAHAQVAWRLQAVFTEQTDRGFAAASDLTAEEAMADAEVEQAGEAASRAADTIRQAGHMTALFTDIAWKAGQLLTVIQSPASQPSGDDDQVM